MITWQILLCRNSRLIINRTKSLVNHSNTHSLKTYSIQCQWSPSKTLQGTPKSRGKNSPQWVRTSHSKTFRDSLRHSFSIWNLIKMKFSMIKESNWVYKVTNSLTITISKDNSPITKACPGRLTSLTLSWIPTCSLSYHLRRSLRRRKSRRSITTLKRKSK